MAQGNWRQMLQGTVAIVAGVLSLGLAGVSIMYLFMEGEIFWVSIIFMLNLVAFERIVRYYLATQNQFLFPGAEHVMIALVSFMTFAIVEVGGTAMAVNSRAPYLVFLFSLYQMLRGMQRFSTVKNISGKIRYPLMLLVIFFGMWFFYWAGLGSNLGNAGELFGEAGFGVSQGINTAVQTTTDTWEQFSNTALSPRRNPNVARMQCTWEMFTSGSFASGGSTAVQNCVDEKLGRNETESESAAVTQPVTVQVAEQPTFEPFRDHLRTTFSITNTLVNDITGRPIDIPAEDVEVRMTWKYLGEPVGDPIVREIGRVPNGENRLITVNEAPAGSGRNYSLPVARITSQQTTADIEAQMNSFDKFCIKGNGDNVKENCDRTMFWLLFGLGEGFESDSGSSDTFDLGQGDLNPQRLAFFIRTHPNVVRESDFIQATRDDRSYGSNEGYRLLYESVGTLLESGQPILMASGANDDRQYNVEIEIGYDYSAEAAFTQSSRWRSGNHLLTIYTKSAWEALSTTERDQFEQSNCNTVTRYGREITKQRTAALTTPIIPVMYTDCSATLFNRFPESGDTATVEIEVGANVNDDAIAEDNGFKITDAETNCGTGGVTTELEPSAFLPPGDGDGWFDYQEGVGYQINPVTVDREVTIPGEQISIGCAVTMDFRINKINSVSYTIPFLG